MLILVFTVKHDYPYRSLRMWSFNRWKGLWYLGESRKSRPSCGSWRSWWSLGGRAENLKHAKTHYGICIITHSTWLHTTVELIVFALQHVPPRSTRLIPQPLANKCVLQLQIQKTSPYQHLHIFNAFIWNICQTHLREWAVTTETVLEWVR